MILTTSLYWHWGIWRTFCNDSNEYDDDDDGDDGDDDSGHLNFIGQSMMTSVLTV